MNKTSTSDLLLLHIYSETTSSQKDLIVEKLSMNEDLQAEYTELVRSKQMLNKLVKSPSDTSLRIIMEHSYKTEHLQEI
ncbi:MAG: hypothetical protein U0T74_05365 [Chitinophagales bacterium]